eukprot:3046887-Rhodomonas_salina.1
MLSTAARLVALLAIGSTSTNAFTVSAGVHLQKSQMGAASPLISCAAPHSFLLHQRWRKDVSELRKRKGKTLISIFLPALSLRRSVNSCRLRMQSQPESEVDPRAWEPMTDPATGRTYCACLNFALSQAQRSPRFLDFRGRLAAASMSGVG